jgi:DNA polymerase III subunit epsilon
MTHQLEPTDSGQRCAICGQSWKNPPTSDCPGVMVYAWGKWPEHLLTKKQMSDAGLQTGKKLPPPSGVVWRGKSPGGVMYLYDRGQGVPKKQLNEKALASLKAAAEKSRQGWYCTRCGHPVGFVDSKGYFRARYLNPPGLCFRCSDRESAQAWARGLLADECLILDTETTGLDAGHNEIVQIAVINPAGETLFDTYVNPQHPERLLERNKFGLSASDINGITPDLLLGAPTWPAVYARLLEIVAGHKLVIYNAEFDEAMLAADCARHGLQHQPFDADCAMLAYAQFIGDWSSYWKDYRWQSLNGGHTALSDCLACLGLLRGMAELEPERT